MEMDDPRLRELDSLIKEGQDIQQSEHSNARWKSTDAVNSLRFTAWSTHSVQFFMDNIKGRNAYVDQFKVMKNESDKRIYPTKEDIRVGVRLLQDLLKYLFDNPSLDSKPVEKHKHISKERISPNRKIFIVHGHDHGLLGDVEHYLESLNLKPIVLNKQADLGKTIIEKVEHYVALTSFAIVILTKDDFGVSKIDYNIETEIGSKVHELDNLPIILINAIHENEIDKITPVFELVDSSKRMLTKIKPRARQNVIFELGLTIGHLGRDKVRVLYEEDVELPTDIHGLAYTPLSGDWKKKLAQEIDASGIAIDPKFL
jgi:predicted nucleotide-binding protein